jgi:hypothetical protein
MANYVIAVWKHIPRGGYAYIFRIPCVVLDGGKVRKKILVRKVTGEIVQRSVKIESLDLSLSDKEYELATAILRETDLTIE